MDKIAFSISGSEKWISEIGILYLKQVSMTVQNLKILKNVNCHVTFCAFCFLFTA